MIKGDKGRYVPAQVWGCGRRLTAVVDCSHALQEKKGQEKNKVKHRSHKTCEESSAQETDEASEEGGQEEAIPQDDIHKRKSLSQKENPSAPCTTVGDFG
jgi:hypothetical protein